VRAFLYLTATVLVAIAIGVGVSASSWREPTQYGPPGYRFLASYPGKVTCTSIPSPMFGQSLMGEECQSGRFSAEWFDVEVINVTVLRNSRLVRPVLL
jgi:hypothetical protein